ncbi:MAG: biotin synthase BioB [Deltaproteobacteria bacterium]|nr:biotin synthase BioB [Deltaproteobacteria bacterium]
MKNHPLETALDKGIKGIGITGEEALALAALPDERILSLLAVTDEVRRAHKGASVNLCAIVNAKSGLCKEDCSFCSQSIKYSTGVDEYPILPPDEILNAAKEAENSGAREFSIVTSGSRIEKAADVDALCASLEAMKESVDMERCASLGMVKKDVLARLKESGLMSFHHNLETGRSFFPNVCTTHSYDEDVAAVKAAKEAGLYVCSGGIFGLGEGWDARIELGRTLAEIDVDSVPINFLNPRPGTPLEHARNLTPIECLKIIAIMRLLLPKKDIVVCGGRQVNLRDLQPLIFAGGANGMMIGNYLTTQGRNATDDLRMISDLGLKPRACHESAV